MTLRIANIGRGGALVEALAPLQMHAVYPATLVLGEVETDVRLRVCHVRSPAVDTEPFLFGIEFLDLPSAGAAAIEQLLLQAEMDAGAATEPEL